MWTARRLARWLAAALALVAGSGCAYRMISNGHIRPEAFDSVLDRTMRARSIRVDTPPPAQVATRESLLVVLEQVLDQEFPVETLRIYERSLVAVGLWPPDQDLREQFLAVFSGEVAGLYVPATGTIYVVEGVPLPFSLRRRSFFTRRDLEAAEFVLSHEIVHWLQHHAYPELLDPELPILDQDDLGNALQAAIEGDALRYGYEAVGIDASVLAGEDFGQASDDEVAASAGEALEDSPALLRLTLAFPYVAGLSLSLAEGPLLLDQPPASTEQALHASRRHESFLAFDLRPAYASLPTGCVPVHENTMGELYQSVLFRDLAATVAPEDWMGWDGDRFLVAECAGRFEFVWLTAWDSDLDAEEFDAAYRAIAPAVAARAGHAAPPETRRSGSEVVVTTPGLRALAAEIGARASRGRVTELAELRAHFEVPAPPASP